MNFMGRSRGYGSQINAVIFSHGLGTIAAGEINEISHLTKFYKFRW